MTSSNKHAGMTAPAGHNFQGEVERVPAESLEPKRDVVTGDRESFEAALNANVGEIRRLEQLLTVACQQLEKAKGFFPVTLEDWWSERPEAVAEQARRVLLSISPKDVKVLNRYLAQSESGQLPEE